MRSAKRLARPGVRDEPAREAAFMATAMQETVGRLREQEQAMQARAEASERLASEIIAGMTSGLLVVHADGVVRTLNPAARSLLRLPETAGTDSARSTLRDVLAGAPALVEVIEECLVTALPLVRRSITLEPADGQSVGTTHLGVTVSPILEAEGGQGGAICLFTDLTAVVDLEERLRLKESLATVGELTAGIAHEFRNGLATIHGYARLLDPALLPESLHPYVVGIREETEALRNVVMNFLNFAKPAELHLAPVELRALADRAAEDVRPEVRARGGSVRVLGEFGRVDGDEVLLRQALINLCRNALEACVDDGIVPTIILQGAIDQESRLALLTVSDNGPGVKPAAQDRVFHPFFTTRKQGTGLGLAIVQKIVVIHNGRVTLVPSSSGGARFVVAIPILSA
jgi:signal transduction histidine kinase